METEQFFIAGTPPDLALCPQACLFRTVWRWRLVRRSGMYPVRDNTRGLTHGATVAINGASQGIAEIAQQVPSVGGLQSIGGAQASGFRVAARPIADDHLDTGMPLQPVRHHFSLALRQQVDGATALQVANDGAVALAASPGPFVDTDDAWR